MKKVITLLLAFYFAIIPIRTYASGASVEIDVKGQVNKGESIDILVNVKDVEKFYAASVDFIYDTNFLKVDSIQATDFITQHSNDIMELGGEVDKNGNTATYSFTFLGDKEGISGSGNLVTIKAIVLSDGKLSISEDNMKIKLVQRSGDTVENYPFSFVGYNIEGDNTEIIPKPEDNNNEQDDSSSNQTNDNVDKQTSTDISEKNDNNDLENKNETTNNQENLDDKENDNKELNNTYQDNKEEINIDNPETEVALIKRNSSISYIIIGAIVLVVLGLGSYKIYKDKSKKEIE